MGFLDPPPKTLSKSPIFTEDTPARAAVILRDEARVNPAGTKADACRDVRVSCHGKRQGTAGNTKVLPKHGTNLRLLDRNARFHELIHQNTLRSESVLADAIHTLQEIFAPYDIEDS